MKLLRWIRESIGVGVTVFFFWAVSHRTLGERFADWRFRRAEKARGDKEIAALCDRMQILLDRNDRLFEEVMYLNKELAEAMQKVADEHKALVSMEMDRNKVGGKLSRLKSFLNSWPDDVDTPPEVNEILNDDYDYW